MSNNPEHDRQHPEKLEPEFKQKVHDVFWYLVDVLPNYLVASVGLTAIFFCAIYLAVSINFGNPTASTACEVPDPAPIRLLLQKAEPQDLALILASDLYCGSREGMTEAERREQRAEIVSMLERSDPDALVEIMYVLADMIPESDFWQNQAALRMLGDATVRLAQDPDRLRELHSQIPNQAVYLYFDTDQGVVQVAVAQDRIEYLLDDQANPGSYLNNNWTELESENLSFTNLSFISMQIVQGEQIVPVVVTGINLNRSTTFSVQSRIDISALSPRQPIMVIVDEATQDIYAAYPDLLQTLGIEVDPDSFIARGLRLPVSQASVDQSTGQILFTLHATQFPLDHPLFTPLADVSSEESSEDAFKSLERNYTDNDLGPYFEVFSDLVARFGFDHPRMTQEVSSGRFMEMLVYALEMNRLSELFQHGNGGIAVNYTTQDGVAVEIEVDIYDDTEDVAIVTKDSNGQIIGRFSTARDVNELLAALREEGSSVSTASELEVTELLQVYECVSPMTGVTIQVPDIGLIEGVAYLRRDNLTIYPESYPPERNELAIVLVPMSIDREFGNFSAIEFVSQVDENGNIVYSKVWTDENGQDQEQVISSAEFNAIFQQVRVAQSWTVPTEETPDFDPGT